jgi:hypothetical protein
VCSSAAAAEAEVRREMSAEAGGDLAIPQAERFDSNIITPVSCVQRESLEVAKPRQCGSWSSGGMACQSTAQLLVWDVFQSSVLPAAVVLVQLLLGPAE